MMARDTGGTGKRATQAYGALRQARQHNNNNNNGALSDTPGGGASSGAEELRKRNAKKDKPKVKTSRQIEREILEHILIDNYVSWWPVSLSLLFPLSF